MPTIRPANPHDRAPLTKILCTRWGGTSMALRGELLDVLTLPALVAQDSDGICGLLTYRFLQDACEIVSLDALQQWRGIGTRLIDAVAGIARSRGLRRLIVVTTNDNVDALRFYQRRGFVLSAIRPNAIVESRRLKPTIPLTGSYDIPIRDEVELVRTL
jgi:GNAT superfamily N-acetyltransferase